MTKLPDDMIDAAEGPLARRVGAYTDQAIFPIDPVAIAASASVAGRRRSLASRLFGSSGAAARLALMGGVAVVAVAGLGVVISGGANGLFAPRSTPTPAPVAVRLCRPDELNAVITAWDGAAGNRIATVELRQIGTTACVVSSLPQPWLADGNGAHMIDGKAGVGGTPITIAPGDVLYTLVDAANYCGPDPVAPVTVAFTQGGASDGTLFVATALTPNDLSGVPPCNGPGAAATIQMHPWSRNAATP